MIKVGIVLSGGGARCVAHLGVLQGLEDLGIKPEATAGASAGAVMAALYAAGYSPTEILEAIKVSSSSGLMNKLVSGSGLFTTGGLKQFLQDLKLPSKFELLKLPLWVAATDLRSCRPVTFSKGLLHAPLMGSCAVPGIFQPVQFEGYTLADGGILDNLPVKEIRQACQILIGSNVNKLNKSLPKNMSRLQTLDRCFHLIIDNQVAVNSAFCDHYLQPDLSKFPMMELKYPDRLFKAGYRAVMEQKHKLLDYVSR